MAGRRKTHGRLNAQEAALLPEDQRPDWYRPAKGKGNGSPKAAPFQPGNVLNLGPGHRSPRVYGEVSRALVAGLLEQRPDLAAYPEAVGSWADAEARAALLRAYLDENGLADESGKPRENLLRQLERFENRANSARVQLGLDPHSEAELALLRAKATRAGALGASINLGDLASAGRAALERPGADPVRAALDNVRAEAENSMTNSEEDQP